MRNKVFTLLIFIMFILGISIFVFPQKENSEYERRGLHINSELSNGNIVETSELILKDQFPIRDMSITIINKINKLFNTPFGSRLLKVKDDVVAIDNDTYVNEFINLTDSNKETALNKAYNIKSIAEKYPNIKTYIYFPTRIEETNLLNNGNNISVYPKLKEEFLGQLNSNIKISSLVLNSEEDFNEYFYKTDRHWNGEGAYQGYTDVINMIKQDFDIDGPKDATFEECKYDFYGNYGASVGYQCNPDHITLINKQLNAYDYYINGIKTDNNSEQLYKENGIANLPYSDYDVAFGDNAFIREFNFHQEDKPNLLIFADSFINPIKDLVASHFNKTIIIDMRANDGAFNLDKIIKENNINAVLFLQYYDNLYFNGYLFIPLS